MLVYRAGVRDSGAQGALFVVTGRRAFGLVLARLGLAARSILRSRFVVFARGRGQSRERGLHALARFGDALFEMPVRVVAGGELRAQRLVLVGETAHGGQNPPDAFAELLDFLGCLIHGAMVYETRPRGGRPGGSPVAFALR